MTNPYSIEYRCWKMIRDYFHDSHKAALWFNTNNPLLGDQKPIDMIINGKLNKLFKFIENAIDGNNP